MKPTALMIAIIWMLGAILIALMVFEQPDPPPVNQYDLQQGEQR